VIDEEEPVEDDELAHPEQAERTQIGTGQLDGAQGVVMDP
jgi:hypothetical protein